MSGTEGRWPEMIGTSIWSLRDRVRQDNYQQRVRNARDRIFNPNVAASVTLCDKEDDTDEAFTELRAMIKYENGNFSLREAVVDSADLSNDNNVSIVLTAEEARKTYAFLDDHLNSGYVNGPGYNVLLGWARRVASLWAEGEMDFLRLLGQEIHDYLYSYTPGDEDDDPEEDACADDPGDGVLSTPFANEIWADEMLYQTPWPEVDASTLNPRETMTIKQEKIAYIRGEKIKTEYRVLEIKVIEGEENQGNLG